MTTKTKLKEIGKMSKSSTRSGGVGFMGLLQVAFIVLKLVGVISWSWGLVLLPIWIGVFLLLCVIVIAVLAAKNRY